MITAGLTGGIGTGKSTVSSMFQEAGAVIVDADRIAREVVTPGKPAWKSIVEGFGKRILLPNQEIDRNALGNIIFHDAAQKERLNRMVHPYVLQEMNDRLCRIQISEPDSVVIQDIPLLLELGMHRKMTDVILVYIPESIQLVRLMKRDRISETEAWAKIRSQIPIEEKKGMVNIVIDNSHDPAHTRSQTLRVYEYLKNKRTHQDMTWNG